MKAHVDFLYVINSNLPPIPHRFRDIALNMSKIVMFNYPYCVQSDPPPRCQSSVYNTIVSDILLKLDVLGYIFVAKCLGISSTTFMQCVPEATEFG